jgi:hypothetical protein
MNKLQTMQNYTTQTIQPRLELNSDTIPVRLMSDAKFSATGERENEPHYLG